MNGKWFFSLGNFEIENFTEIIDLKTSMPLNEIEITSNPTPKCMLVVWPKRFEFDIFLKTFVFLVIDKLYGKIMNKSQPIDDQCRDEFKRLIEKLKQEALKGCTNKALNALMFDMLIEFNDLALINEYLDFFALKMNLTLSEPFARLIAKFGYDALRDRLQAVIVPSLKYLIPNCQFILVKKNYLFVKLLKFL